MIDDYILINKKIAPDQICISSDQKYFTNAQMNISINKIALYVQNNINSSKVIGIQILDSILLYQTIIALNRINKVPLIFPNYNNIDDYLHETKINISITDQIILEALETKDEIKISDKEYNANDTQLIVFTSGSSGMPKAVELSYKNIYKSAINWNAVLEFSKKDIYINCLPAYHVGGLNIFFRSIIYNMNMYVIKFNAESILDRVKKSRNVIISVVPTMLKRLLDCRLDGCVENFKSIVVGSDILPYVDAKRSIEIKLPLYISYGMTETCSGIAGFWATRQNIDNYKYKPHNNVDIIVDNSIINVNSDVVMKSYFKEMKTNNILITNDIGANNTDDSISVFGRNDNIVISGGENISLDLIYNKIMRLSKVYKCYISAVLDDEWGQKIKVDIIVKDSSKNAGLYRKKIEKILPKIMIPKEINIIEKI